MLLNDAVEPLLTVCVSVAELLVDELLKSILMPLALHALPSFLIVIVALFWVAVAVKVVAAPALKVVLALVALVIVLDVLLLVQIVPLKLYPLAAVATIAWMALLLPKATNVPPSAKLLPLNVMVALLNAPVIV